MPESDPDDSRKAVTTYVPAYQKAEWERHAADLEMSQAEFLRTMVQAGRKFDETGSDLPRSSGSDPGGDMEETVIQALETNGPLSWAELLEEVTDDIESQLEETIVSLQESGQIGHQPRDGTYTLRDR